MYKIAGGVFLGLLGFAVVMAIFWEIERRREAEQFNALISQLFPPQAAPRPRVFEKLAADQSCLNGTIVRCGVRGGVPYAVQLLENNRPVRCEGDHRL